MLEAFIKKINRNQDLVLPGWEAQQKMAPSYRVKYEWNDILKQNPRRAAVLILMYEEDGIIKFPFFLRNEYKGVHSNQISLPGGSYEEEDQTYEVNAKRETAEELGLNFDDIEIVKNLSEIYIPPSKFLVYPFIGYYKGIPDFHPDEIEVKEIITLTLDQLLDDQLEGIQEVSTFFGPFEVPAFNLKDKQFIWGATAMILKEFKVYLQALAKLA